ncbi:MAG: hypothetical protein B0D92_04555 [Spirochaeta sp. LUC14_002_19_P3]|nr:MAG: hypothetical protein B0D92_04555 [Spirochaeta sp. LUC14_002_19_P3]
MEEELRRFRNIQVYRYLSSRPQQCFSGQCEYDAVMRMIYDAWIELYFSDKLEKLSRQGLDTLYFNTVIVFPDFVADTPQNSIPVDFITGKKMATVS